MESIFTPESYRLVMYIMLFFALVYVVFEVYLNLNELEDDTTNIILLEASKKQFFFVPFALGAIMGHLFLGAKTNILNIESWLAVVLVFGISLVMLAIGFWVPFKKSNLFLTILLVAGLAYGHFIWSQNFRETVFFQSGYTEQVKYSVEPTPSEVGVSLFQELNGCDISLRNRTRKMD